VVLAIGRRGVIVSTGEETGNLLFLAHFFS
jgi:hypothetical protein